MEIFYEREKNDCRQTALIKKIEEEKARKF